MTSERVGWISIGTNIFLFLIKYWVGLISGSIALIADAWHTLSDSFSSVAVIVGLRISKVPPDREHPYGHGRAELIATLLIGFILAVIGLNFFKDAIGRLIDEKSVQFGFWAKAVTIISILGKEGLAQLSFYIGRKNESPSLLADGWHHRSDALSSIIILIGIYLGGKYWWLDGVLGLIVAGLILYSSFDIIKEVWADMLGKSADEKTTRKLNKIVNGMFPEEIYLHHVHMHIYGDHKELTFHIKLPPDMTLKQAHDIANRIEEKVRRDMNIEATIHMEPLNSN
jgi:cation diffusion facilitator family transporter